jgi:hypothetical protein
MARRDQSCCTHRAAHRSIAAANKPWTLASSGRRRTSANTQPSRSSKGQSVTTEAVKMWIVVWGLVGWIVVSLAVGLLVGRCLGSGVRSVEAVARSRRGPLL